MSRLVHWSLESFPYSRIGKRSERQEILEVGSGHGQHLQYLRENFSKYVMTDIRPENIPAQLLSANTKIHQEPVDAHLLPFENHQFDRVIATCLLIHLKEPQVALKEWYRVVRPGGLLTIYVPCETGLVLRLAQQLTTRRKQRKLGLEAEYLHRIEHPYSYLYLKAILLHMFPNEIVIRKFPFIFGSWNLNLWSVITIEKKS